MANILTGFTAPSDCAKSPSLSSLESLSWSLLVTRLHHWSCQTINRFFIGVPLFLSIAYRSIVLQCGSIYRVFPNSCNKKKGLIDDEILSKKCQRTRGLN